MLHLLRSINTILNYHNILSYLLFSENQFLGLTTMWTVIFSDFLGCIDVFWTAHAVKVFLFHVDSLPVFLSLQTECWWKLLWPEFRSSCLHPSAHLLETAFPVSWGPSWQNLSVFELRLVFIWEAVPLVCEVQVSGGIINVTFGLVTHGTWLTMVQKAVTPQI